MFVLSEGFNSGGARVSSSVRTMSSSDTFVLSIPFLCPDFGLSFCPGEYGVSRLFEERSYSWPSLPGSGGLPCKASSWLKVICCPCTSWPVDGSVSRMRSHKSHWIYSSHHSWDSDTIGHVWQLSDSFLFLVWGSCIGDRPECKSSQGFVVLQTYWPQF